MWCGLWRHDLHCLAWHLFLSGARLAGGGPSVHLLLAECMRISTVSDLRALDD
jgi:hypothetical protein